MKMKILPQVFDYYAFDSNDALQAVPRSKIFIQMVVPGDYSLMAIAGSDCSGSASVEQGWRCIVIDEQLEFDAIGIASAITGCLAREKISVLVMSGFKTDYFFVKQEVVVAACQCLALDGHTF